MALKQCLDFTSITLTRFHNNETCAGIKLNGSGKKLMHTNWIIVLSPVVITSWNCSRTSPSQLTNLVAYNPPE